jgi:hypothetical protein
MPEKPFIRRNPELTAISQRRLYAEKAKQKYTTYRDYLETLPASAPHNMYRTNEQEVARVQRRLDRLEKVLGDCSTRTAEIMEAESRGSVIAQQPSLAQPCPVVSD